MASEGFRRLYFKSTRMYPHALNLINIYNETFKKEVSSKVICCSQQHRRNCTFNSSFNRNVGLHSIRCIFSIITGVIMSRMGKKSDKIKQHENS